MDRLSTPDALRKYLLQILDVVMMTHCCRDECRSPLQLWVKRVVVGVSGVVEPTHAQKIVSAHRPKNGAPLRQLNRSQPDALIRRQTGFGLPAPRPDRCRVGYQLGRVTGPDLGARENGCDQGLDV